MKYSREEIQQYIVEEEVKFIRMAFCDIYGKQKNISIMADEFGRAYEHGIAIDASAVPGFGDVVHSDLLLFPDTSTLTALPWRPEHGRVVRMLCAVKHPDGTPCAADCRSLLQRAAADAAQEGITFAFGSEMEFYLFRRDENGEPTRIPYDNAGYMDIAPEDKGENVRREICLTLEQMGIQPERSHHEEGPGQNEIDFRYADPVTAADNAVTFRTVVHTIAARNGLCADFSPKPLAHAPGNGMHVNFSVHAVDGRDVMPEVIAGILAHITEMTAFLNATEESYHRFGVGKAPGYISWSRENRSQLIRIPAAEGEYCRAELRSPDPTANPYLAFALLIYAGLYGIQSKPKLPEGADFNLFKADAAATANLARLPETLRSACQAAADSAFIRAHLPQAIRDIYCNR